MEKLFHAVECLISKEKEVVGAYKRVAESFSEFGSVFESESVSEINQENVKNVSKKSKSVSDMMNTTANELSEFVFFPFF